MTASTAKGKYLWKGPCFSVLTLVFSILLLSTQFHSSFATEGKQSGNNDSRNSSGERNEKEGQSGIKPDGIESCPKGQCCKRNDTSGNNTTGCPLQTKLLLVQVIFRHGDRTPLFTYPKDPHKNASGIPMLKSKRKGLLTKRGKVQAYELGWYLHSRYKEFLDGIWLPEDVLVQSSYSERAIMTAQTCLAGMFIPYCVDGPQHPAGTGLGCEKRWSRDIKWQPIPVYPIPLEQDNKLRFQPERCPAYMQELENVLGCSAMQTYQAGHKEVFEHIKNNSGVSHVDMRNLGQVYDTLFIQDLYDLPLPEWTKKVYPEPMKSIEEFGFQVLSGTRQMIRLNGGPLLRQVIHNMQRVAKELVKKNCPKRKKEGKKVDRPKKLYLFSGHDTTVSAFLSALGVFDIHQPPYASAVIIELHQEVDGEDETESAPGTEKNYLDSSGRDEDGRGNKAVVSMKDMIVKVFYRNSTKETPREMIIPDCQNPCYLEKLEKEVRDLLISDEEWRIECQGGGGLFSWIMTPFTCLFSALARLVKWLWSSVWYCGRR